MTDDRDAATAELRARLALALAEIERLSRPDDHGSGERTARLAGLAAWEAEAERLRSLLDELHGA